MGSARRCPRPFRAIQGGAPGSTEPLIRASRTPRAAPARPRVGSPGLARPPCGRRRPRRGGGTSRRAGTPGATWPARGARGAGPESKRPGGDHLRSPAPRRPPDRGDRRGARPAAGARPRCSGPFACPARHGPERMERSPRAGLRRAGAAWRDRRRAPAWAGGPGGAGRLPRPRARAGRRGRGGAGVVHREAAADDPAGGGALRPRSRRAAPPSARSCRGREGLLTARSPTAFPGAAAFRRALHAGVLSGRPRDRLDPGPRAGRVPDPAGRRS